MAFKMKGSPFQRNFGIGSPLKQDEVAYGGTKTWKEGEDAAKRHKQDLNDLVRERNKAKEEFGKDSNPYATAQNKINQYLGSSKRHKLKADENTKVKNVETKKSDKNVVKNTETGDKEKLKTKYYDQDKTKIKKEKLVTKDEEGVSKTVVKYDEDGNITKEKGYTTGDKKNETNTADNTEKSKKEKRQEKRAQNKKDRQDKREANKKKRQANRNKKSSSDPFMKKAKKY